MMKVEASEALYHELAYIITSSAVNIGLSFIGFSLMVRPDVCHPPEGAKFNLSKKPKNQVMRYLRYSSDMHESGLKLPLGISRFQEEYPGSKLKLNLSDFLAFLNKRKRATVLLGYSCTSKA
eukprot:2704962-Amphidinium_carterae.1